MAAVDFQERLLNGLGGPWPEAGPLNSRITKTIHSSKLGGLSPEQQKIYQATYGEKADVNQRGFTIQYLTYNAELGDSVPALLLIPDGVSAKQPAPAIAIWHQHAGQYHLGKSEPAGLAGNPMHHTGAALAREGYVVLCPDALCFEERQDPEKKLKRRSFEEFEFLKYVVNGKCLAWKNILDMKRAIDYLSSRPEVIEGKLGCYGHSMGSTHLWLVGPWEKRLKCLVGNCCLPTYRGIQKHKLLHCFPNFIPDIMPYGDTPDVAALIAPRALHLNFGELDSGSPIEEAKRGIETIELAYASVHADRNFTHYIAKDTGHVLNANMWSHAKSVFAKHLR